MPPALTLLAALLAPAPQAEGATPEQGSPPRPKSLLVITLDTTRRDFMGFHGRAPSPTPNLDALAARSVVFEDAYTVAPLTLPAHSSLFTGLYPHAHGVHDNAAFKLPQSARTLAEVLKERGFATAAAVGAFVLDPMFGIDQGFERYDAPPAEFASQGITERPADAMVELAIRDLRALAASAPFFYWLHLFDPHFPYAAPAADGAPPAAIDATRGAYEAEIRFADAQLGRLLAEVGRLGLAGDLVILFASDHGESLRDGIEASHGYFLFDPTVRIPLVLHCPGIAARRVDAQVSLVDVAPTLLGLLGVGDGGMRFDGVDLAPMLRASAGEEGEKVDAPDRALLLESWYSWLNYGWAPLDGCVKGSLKHLASRRLELYDRASDAREQTNLFAPDEPRSRAMAVRLADLLRPAQAALERDPLTLTGRDLARLLAMGYAAGSERSERPPDAATLPDSYDKVAVIHALEEVVLTEFLQDHARKIELLRQLVEQEPASAHLHEKLGIELFNQRPDGREESERHLREAIRLEPKSSRSHHALGRIFDERADALREELKRRRADGASREDLRDLVADERKWARRAIRSYRTCLEFEPNLPAVIERLVRGLCEESDRSARAGEKEEALAELKEAGDLLDRWLAFLPEDHPDRAKVLNNRAWVAKRRAELEKPP